LTNASSTFRYMSMLPEGPEPRDPSDAELIRALKALADATRFRMVQEIAASGELSCGQVSEHFDVSQPTISHHLKILVEAGILTSRSEGKHHYIAVNHALLGRFSHMMTARLSPNAKRERQKLASARRQTG
jgi:ArsR family transcriptional regulator